MGAALVDARLFGRPRAYGGNSQEWNAFKFVFKSYIGVAHPMLAAMIHAETLRESIMLSLSKRRTAIRPSSAGHGPVMEIGWVKGKGQGKGKNKENGKGKGKSRGKGKEKTKSEKFEGWCNNFGKWGHKAANCWHGKEKQVHQVQGKAGTASSSSSQSTLSAM